MKRTFSVLFSLLTLPVTISFSFPAATHAEPAYAKWGRLAMKEAIRRYPGVQIVDYKHMGRKTISPKATEEAFKLLIKQNNKQREVFVRIQFDTATEKPLTVRFSER